MKIFLCTCDHQWKEPDDINHSICPKCSTESNTLLKRVYTHDELQTFVEAQWLAMTEDEEQRRIQEADPTFEEFILHAMKPHLSVEINKRDYSIFPTPT